MKKRGKIPWILKKKNEEQGWKGHRRRERREKRKEKKEKANVLGAFLAILLLLHGAPKMKIRDEIPPNQRLSALIRHAVNAEPTKILYNHVFPIVAHPKILLRIRRAVSAIVDALEPALTTEE